MDNDVARSWKDPQHTRHGIDNPVGPIAVGGLTTGPNLRVGTEHFMTIGCCTTTSGCNTAPESC